MVKDVIIDYESLGYQPDGIVVDLAAVVYEENPKKPPKFKDLRKNAFHVKFKIKEQKGLRLSDQSVKEFWRRQDKSVQQMLLPNSDDVSLEEGHKQFLQWCEEQGVDWKRSHIYSRGNEFDMGLLTDILRQVFKTRDTLKIFPVAFWNVRDVRTAIERILMTRDMTITPLKKGVMEGFKKHDSVDDCAAAALQLVYAVRYAMGYEDPPSDDEVDENTVSKRMKH